MDNALTPAPSLTPACDPRAAEPSDLVVYLLLDRNERVVSIWDDEVEPVARAAKYNAERSADGEPDPDAPYSVEPWRVRMSARGEREREVQL